LINDDESHQLFVSSFCSQSIKINFVVYNVTFLMGVFLSSASAESIIDEVKPFMARMPQFAYQVRLWPKEDLLGQ
jgi:hypothetical protein